MVTPNPAPGSVMDLNPESFVEGGGPPIQQNLTLKEARFCYFNYEGKADKTVALRLTLDTDDGTTHLQHYSVGDPQRWMPSADGKSVQAMGTAKAGNKNSNFGILMVALVNAGFPKQMLGRDISVLDGLYAYWDGMPEPKRPGLARTEAQNQRERVILVPTKVLRLPGQAGVPTMSAIPAMPTMPTPPSFMAPAPTPPTLAPAVNGQVDYQQLVASLLSQTAQAKGNAFSLQDLATAAFVNHGGQPYRDSLVAFIMSQFPAQLQGLGYQMDQQFRITKK